MAQEGVIKDQSNSIVGRVLALHTTNLDLIPGSHIIS